MHTSRRRDGGTDFVVRDFIHTMPQSYRARFDAAAAREHARIAHERGRRLAHAGLFGKTHGAGPALCVVARDAPGLLASISASLMLEGFDITQADAYTRRLRRGAYEAVDLFWVRRERQDSIVPLTDEDASAVRATLVEVLSGSGSLRPPPRAASGETPGAAETSIRFTEPEAGNWLTLELEANDRTGLLLAVTSALFSEGVQIIGSRIVTRGLRAHDRFDLVESDGSRLAGTRLRRIQLAVLAAVDGPSVPHRSVSTAPMPN